MDKKVLYVSDLDGTLMRNDLTISEYSVKTINELISHGLAFTYATARSIESAREITGDLKITLPVVTRNGAVLADNVTGAHLEKAVFADKEIIKIKELIPEITYFGFVSCFTGDKMIKAYADTDHSEGLSGYIGYYVNDPRMVKVENMEGMFTGNPGYVTLIGSKKELEPVFERVSAYDGWESMFQKDTYRDEYWIEICPKNCTKAKSILKLKEEYGFEKLVVFGDSLNDVSMFKAADEAYAVSNAYEELKSFATAVIGSNEEDSVAAFIKNRFEGIV